MDGVLGIAAGGSQGTLVPRFLVCSPFAQWNVMGRAWMGSVDRGREAANSDLTELGPCPLMNVSVVVGA